jgi:hypothetical protein
MERKEEIPAKREKSAYKVIIELRKGAKRFKDLEEATRLSPAGLNETLKMMKKNRMIEKNIVDKKQLYRLTGKGENYNPSISYDITPIQLRSGSNYRDYSRLRMDIRSRGFDWGIESVMTVDKDIENLKLLEPKDVMEIEELIYKKMKNNMIKNKKIVNNGKMVLGFSIDYNEIRRSIDQKSLEYVDNMSKEEARLIMKRNEDPEEFTDKDEKRWLLLQKKTFEKIKKL